MTSSKKPSLYMTNFIELTNLRSHLLRDKKLHLDEETRERIREFVAAASNEELRFLIQNFFDRSSQVRRMTRHLDFKQPLRGQFAFRGEEPPLPDNESAAKE